jgi:hypothetical protein
VIDTEAAAIYRSSFGGSEAAARPDHTIAGVQLRQVGGLCLRERPINGVSRVDAGPFEKHLCNVEFNRPSIVWSFSIIITDAGRP